MYTKVPSTLLLALFAFLLVSVDALPRVRSPYISPLGIRHKSLIGSYRSFTQTSHQHRLDHYHQNRHHSVCNPAAKRWAQWLLRHPRLIRHYMLFPMPPWPSLRRRVAQQKRHQQKRQQQSRQILLFFLLLRHRWLRVGPCWPVWQGGCRRFRDCSNRHRGYSYSLEGHLLRDSQFLDLLWRLFEMIGGHQGDRTEFLEFITVEAFHQSMFVISMPVFG